MKSAMAKGVFTATVTSNRRIRACYWTMDLEFAGAGAKAFAKFQPGQFVQVDVSGLGLPAEDRIPADLRDVSKRSILLRRPFSFAEVTAGREQTCAELLYCMLGPASMRLTTLGRGAALSFIGPLGRGFWVPPGKRLALLVVGGMGAPPIRCLAKLLRAEYPGVNVIAFVGAKTAASLPFEGQFDEMPEQIDSYIPAFAKFGIPSAVTTDDGSAGRRGFITERLAEWLDEQSAGSQDGTIIYACGPEPMLAATARLAADRNIDCQISMERRMACGIGVCQSCAVECRVEGSDETVYQLCCRDGPVFEARTVVFRTRAAIVEEIGLVKAIQEGQASPTGDEARILEALEHGEEDKS
ncbi:MAG: dihydroorotate dehydrogenase electron transfer subunit [Planctomycetes bacterium]|nr:dihydroorotate dehydrogenase electron transfer subunit [Planctomycetota bacterium]